MSTKAIHGSSLKDVLGAPHLPIYNTTTFAFASTQAVLDVVEGRAPGALYTRYGLNPSIFALEETLAGLEDAEAAWAFCSGMAAETALFPTHGRAGVVCIGDAYGGTLDLLADQLPLLSDPTRPLVFITDEGTDRGELVRQCAGIGFEKIAGELGGGIIAWRDARHPMGQIPLVDVDGLSRCRVLDIRQDSEWRAGHVPGVVHVELGAVSESNLPTDQPVAVMCAHGQRSMTGAILIARERGHTDGLAVFTGSAEERTGQHLEQ